MVETFHRAPKGPEGFGGAGRASLRPRVPGAGPGRVRRNKGDRRPAGGGAPPALDPQGPHDGKNVFLEIRAGVGGEEAALFAADLYRMYAMYGEKQGWKLELTNVSETELGGIKELSCLIQGASSLLPPETGKQASTGSSRVPETESGGRIHTSTCTVAVLPQVEEAEFHLDPPTCALTPSGPLAREDSTSTKPSLPSG